MSDSPIPLAADVFHCPVCGQKHRGDLSAPRAGAEMLARCAGCGAKLWIRWKSGRASVKPAAQRNPGVKEEDTLDLKIPANLSRTASLVGSTFVPPKAAPRRSAAPLEEAGREGSEEGTAPERRSTRLRDKPPVDVPPADAPTDAEFPPGTMIGRYRVESAEGRGGTGTVYRAFDATTNRYIALKILGRDQPTVMRQRFLREIEVVANLRHPNLMPVFDRGEHDGRPFFAMEMLYRPFTLTEIVRMARDGSLSRYVTLKDFESVGGIIRGIFLPVCAAMQVANVENGVIHRDLKPDNVLVDSRTLRPYVIDFGICHVLERRARIGGVTVAPKADDAGIVGTPRYLAPEQARGTVHERTDIWGLGAILRFCLTGEPPIAAANPITRAELKRRIQALTEAQAVAQSGGNEAKVALCSEKLARLEDTGLRTYDDLFQDARDGVYMPLPPEVPPVASAILRKAMSPRPGERYESPRLLADDVAAWMAGTPTQAKVMEVGFAASLSRRAAEALKRHAILAVILTALVTAALVVTLGVLLPRARSRAAEAATWETVLSAAESEMEAASRMAASAPAPADAARVHDALARTLAAHAAAVSRLAEGADRDAAVARVAAVSARIAPQDVEIVASPPTERVSVEDVSRRTPPSLVPAAGLRLRPGEYRIQVGAVRIPVVVPFLVRPATAPSARGGPAHTLRIPGVPDAVAQSMVLVVPCPEEVVCRRPPWAPAGSAPTRVGTFLIDRYETTNGQWVAFLEAIPDGYERERRVPNRDFVEDPARARHFVLQGEGAAAERLRDLPVRGVSAGDAIAYCAWRSREEGATVRLPTEAEWVVAGGLLLGRDLPVDLAGAAEPLGLAALVRARDLTDVSPYGIVGMLGNVREIVCVPSVSDDAPDRYLAKGAGAGDALRDAALLNVHEVAADARDDRTGFRCARDVK